MLPLRQLPAIDKLLRAPELAAPIATLGVASATETLRDWQAQWRSEGGAPEWAGSPAGYADALTRRARQADYRRVFNMTGTLIHTNLGRAPLAREALARTVEKTAANLNLEFDLTTGKRGSRDAPVAQRLAALTGAEAATVVNNNAAAVLLVLNTFAQNREVPVSRGELIEIGGSFRLPELMERANCRLREVGTTNRTRVGDFARAVCADTGLLMKVHPSNYAIEGFTEAPSNRELADLAAESGVPYCVDLGSGTLVDLADFGLPHEPMPQEALRQGADLVTFSGDKLLGGVQSGLIVGKRELIAALNDNPLKRALRCDKLTLVLLAETLKLYENDADLVANLPLLANMTRSLEELRARGAEVAAVLAPKLTGFAIDVVDSDCQIGSGALPDKRVPSVAVRIDHPDDGALRDLLARLRGLAAPVVGRLTGGAAYLDLRSIDDWPGLQATLQELEAAA
ncbi:MAG: L-seryl-tRNA(Sec) selenium transferase [Pseudomonadota bacterium]